METLDKARARIGEQIRALRRERRWTQTELASELQISQSRLSEIERGQGSFTAEQFLLVLKLFNVAVGRFADGSPDRESEIQNALVRLGAQHLHESPEVVPSEHLEDARDVVRETLVEGGPRLIAALAPVIVRNIDRVNLHRLYLDLLSAGLERRLAWLAEMTLEAIQRELAAAPTRAWAQRCRRAALVLSTFLDSVGAAHDGPTPAPDVLDTTIRSRATLDQVRTSSAPVSQKWGIVTRLQISDFVEALRAARGAD